MEWAGGLLYRLPTLVLLLPSYNAARDWICWRLRDLDMVKWLGFEMVKHHLGKIRCYIGLLVTSILNQQWADPHLTCLFIFILNILLSSGCGSILMFLDLDQGNISPMFGSTSWIFFIGSSLGWYGVETRNREMFETVLPQPSYWAVHVGCWHFPLSDVVRQRIYNSWHGTYR